MTNTATPDVTLPIDHATPGGPWVPVVFAWVGDNDSCWDAAALYTNPAGERRVARDQGNPEFAYGDLSLELMPGDEYRIDAYLIHDLLAAAECTGTRVDARTFTNTVRTAIASERTSVLPAGSDEAPHHTIWRDPSGNAQITVLATAQEA